MSITYEISLYDGDNPNTNSGSIRIIMPSDYDNLVTIELYLPNGKVYNGKLNLCDLKELGKVL